jgi:hypothetical protein
MTDENEKTEPTETEKPAKPKKSRAKRKVASDQPAQAEIAASRSYEQNRDALRCKIRMFYDLQRMRLQAEGRILPKADAAPIQLHEVDLNVLSLRVNDLAKAEKMALSDVEEHLHTMPIWTQLLSDRTRFRGLGVTMAAVIVAENDIRRQDTVSKMWSFAGLAPVPAFRCGNCHAVMKVLGEGRFEHPKSKCAYVPVLERKGTKGRGRELITVSTEIEDSIEAPSNRIFDEAKVYAGGRAAHAVRGEKLKFNKFLRTKLLGVLGPCMLKAGSPYRHHYDSYKSRKLAQGWGTGDAHRHVAAIRYMVKQLLIDIHKAWRELEGLSCRAPYHEAVLGHVHQGSTIEGLGDFAPDPNFDPDRDGHVFEKSWDETAIEDAIAAVE